MKWILLFSFFIFFIQNPFAQNSSEIKHLTPCPNSPNCVSTQEERKRKRMRPIPLERSVEFSKKKMKILLEKVMDVNAKLTEEKENHLRYEFKTRIGKFEDDVEFLFDKKTKKIHFRSASRKGWWDMGKNRRRMKKIRKKFENTF